MRIIKLLFGIKPKQYDGPERCFYCGERHSKCCANINKVKTLAA